jgi:hypothetical protein
VADTRLAPLFLSVPLLLSCAAQRSVAAPVEPQGAAPRTVFDESDTRPLPRYHSKRLALSLPLPDGSHWRIDDHSRPELVATHAATRSRVVLAIFRTEDLVGRAQCEAMARDRKLVPEGELHTLEDEVTVTQQAFDTRVWVALRPGGAPDRPLAGHVMAFGGFLRKCYVFAFSTEVTGAADEGELSSRLAYARARILGGLEMDPFGTVSREEAGH